MSQKDEKLKTLLQKLFQLDQPDLDEDISVEGLLAGKPSGESQSSFQKWLAGRSPCLTKRSSRRLRRA